MKAITLRDITLITEDGHEVRVADAAEVRLGNLGDEPATIAQVESLGPASFSVSFTLPPGAWAWANYVTESIIAAAEAKSRAAAEKEDERGDNES